MPRSAKPKKAAAGRGVKSSKGKFSYKNVIDRIAASRQSDRAPENLKLFKDGLPITAYAIREDEYDTATWQLPHHTRDVSRKPVEKTVDFVLLDHAALLLSRWGVNGVRCHADPELIILAARHLADHYRAAGRQIPVALCVLI
jgi:hypothetical protein